MSRSNDHSNNYGISANTVNADALAVGSNANARSSNTSRKRQHNDGSKSTEKHTRGGDKFYQNYNDPRQTNISNINNNVREDDNQQNDVSLPQTNEENAKKLILFIHGLGGSAKETWGNLPIYLKEDIYINENYDIEYYSYPTYLFRLPFFSPLPRIQHLALGLDSEIRNKYSKYKEVVLACHSMGGLVARKYIIDYYVSHNAVPQIKLALFAVPNNGAALAFYAKNLSWRHWQIAQLCKDSDFIDDLNENWARLKLNDLIKVKFYVAGQDRVVDVNSAKAFWGNVNVDMIVDRGHSNLIKPLSAEDSIVRYFKNYLNNQHN